MSGSETSLAAPPAATTSTLVLTLKQQPSVPLEAEAICPDTLAGKSRAEVAAVPLYLGKRQVRLDEFFEVGGAGSAHIELRGDAGKIKWLGRGMTHGKLTIAGNAGMHLGAHMKGGVIEVSGNASDWVGAEMRGGLIRIAGNAGGQVGAAYRGSMAGMNEGTILVGGTAGLEVGMRMKRGVIVMGGLVRDFAGLMMKGGTIFLLNGAELRTGAWMMRGTIVSFKPLPLLPTFAYAGTYQPTFLRIYARYLQSLGVHSAHLSASFQRYVGDSSVPGKGEILILDAK